CQVVARVARGQGRPLTGQTATDGGADASRAAGHEGHTPGELVAAANAGGVVLGAVDEGHGRFSCELEGCAHRTVAVKDLAGPRGPEQRPGQPCERSKTRAKSGTVSRSSGLPTVLLIHPRLAKPFHREGSRKRNTTAGEWWPTRTAAVCAC